MLRDGGKKSARCLRDSSEEKGSVAKISNLCLASPLTFALSYATYGNIAVPLKLKIL